MVAHSGVVTGQAQDVVDTQHSGAQQLRLQSDPVAIPAGQLQNGGQTGILQGTQAGRLPIRMTEDWLSVTFTAVMPLR